MAFTVRSNRSPPTCRTWIIGCWLISLLVSCTTTSDVTPQSFTLQATTTTPAAEGKTVPPAAAEDPPQSPPELCSVCTCPAAGDDASSSSLMDCRGRELSLIPHMPQWLNTDGGNGSHELDLDVNDIHLLPQLPPLARLTHLRISHNRVGEVAPFAIALLPALRLLALGNNDLRRLPGTAFAAPNHSVSLPLEVLDLSYNRLKTLDEDLFDALPHLDTLLLNNNPFHALDASTQAALNALGSLRVLSLAQTSLLDLPDGVVNPVRHLVTLMLDDNELTRVPGVLKSAGALQRLSLNANPIERFQAGDFVGLPELRQLNVSSMRKLTSIERGTFANVTQLQELYCSFNDDLDYIDEAAFGDDREKRAPHLQKLWLHENHLSTLKGGLLPWAQLIELKLQVNWCCDCRTRWMRKLLLPPDHPVLRCSAPADLRGQLLTTVDDALLLRCPGAPASESKHESEAHPINAALLVAAGLAGLSIMGLVSFVVYLVRRRKRASTRSNIYYTKTENESASVESFPDYRD